MLASTSNGSLTRALHVRRSLLARRANWHGLVVWGECAGRRSLETLARRRAIGRHAIARRWGCETVARNSAWCAWETMRSARALEASLLLELRRRWARRETVRRVGWLLLARLTVELGRLLTGCLLLLLLSWTG